MSDTKTAAENKIIKKIHTVYILIENTIKVTKAITVSIVCVILGKDHPTLGLYKIGTKHRLGNS